MSTPLHRRRALRLAGAGALTTLLAALPLAGTAQPAAFPNKPLTLIVPFPAGGPTDAQMRALAAAAGKVLGQSVVVVNQPGVGGTLGPANMARTAAPDGYTLSIAGNTLYRLPLLQKVSYDPLKDFTYLINLTGYTMGIAVRADAPWKTLDDLIADARTRPGQINYGSTGVGSSGHIAMERLAKATGTSFNYIPFKGGAEEATALLGGHIDFISNAGWGAQVDAGKMRLLATYSGKRLKQRPDVPTLKEQGYDLVITSPIGVVGPRGMPAQVVAQLHDALRQAMQDPTYQRLIAQWDQDDLYMSAQAYHDYAQEQMPKEKVFLDQLGIELK
ncbi:tripartite tricarboxylate transporter substrate binding protein [Comamonas faecalis]|uniref:Tripartite tricarboxylate transporter substrate binding protein n=1 Tax=Comamonas faecalis TaxID=1387849 RepID=A0ABP7RW83_9BURK